MSIKHTPGPWDCEHIPGEGEPQEFLYLGPITGSGQIGVDSVFCSIADANLVCAAPDLFQAAKLLDVAYDESDDLPTFQASPNQLKAAWKALRAAIRRAETGA